MTDFELEWDNLVLQVSKHFNVSADFEFLLFVTGIQELGHGFKAFSRSEKMDLINMARCHLFSNMGYLEKSGMDEEGWPTYKTIKSMTGMLPSYQNQLIKKELINYFKNHEII